MTHSVIFGNSLIGYHIADALSSVSPDHRVTILTNGETKVYDRSDLPRFLSQQIPEQEFLLNFPDLARRQNVCFLIQEKVERFHFKKNQIGLDNKTKLTYDFLILADTGHAALPKIRGSHKKNALGFQRLSDLETIVAGLPVTETVVIPARSLWGVELALAMHRRGKEVLLVAPQAAWLANELDQEGREHLASHLTQVGIRLIDDELSDIIGEQDIKAVRLASGKVLACQLVIFPEAGLDLRLFKNTELLLSDFVAVNESFLTNIDNVFAIDHISQGSRSYPGFRQTQEGIHPRHQLRTVVAKIIGQAGDEIPAQTWTLALEVGQTQFDFLGCTVAEEGWQTQIIQGEGPESSARLFLRDSIVCGAVLINQRAWQPILLRAITSQQNIADLENTLGIHKDTGPVSLESQACVLQPGHAPCAKGQDSQGPDVSGDRPLT